MKFYNNTILYISLRLPLTMILFLIKPSSNSSDTKTLINVAITIPYITIGKKTTRFIPTVYVIAVFCMTINPMENIIMHAEANISHFSWVILYSSALRILFVIFSHQSYKKVFQSIFNIKTSPDNTTIAIEFDY